MPNLYFLAIKVISHLIREGSRTFSQIVDLKMSDVVL